MRDTFYTHESLFEKGIAVGSADIARDTVIFRFYEETFEFPTMQVYHMKEFGGFNGWFYTAPVEALRRLEAEVAGGKK